ncbi:DUF2953 domain-containing protein [Chengkuizengella axinellae]|uniref:DUF2953 domain-containing protein n=1 Tax=Chengkuizengella axinellae TaxID=3064388 RepID=A0ABT9IXA9_9BACL|nr:DUF2953 domain-containing protein [Chengkuizengella sp. 2205SS18-9]MDP5273752.1 DUF2953 domain-containing protein [Chengkuizengella sp. 2205SS18-9]
MFWFWGIVIICILTIFFIWFISTFIQVNISFKRIHEDDRFSVDIYLLRRLFHYNYEISLVEFRNVFEGVELKSTRTKSKTNEEPQADSLITPKNIWDYLKHTKELVTHFVGMYKWISQSMSYVHCTHLKWKTSIGVGEAPETAMIAGIVWGVNSNVLSSFVNKIRMDAQPHLEVNPLYNKNDIYIEVECILKIRIAHAILVGIYFMIRMLKAKGGFKTWKNILSKV